MSGGMAAAGSQPQVENIDIAARVFETQLFR